MSNQMMIGEPQDSFFGRIADAKIENDRQSTRLLKTGMKLFALQCGGDVNIGQPANNSLVLFA